MPFNERQRRDSWPPTIICLQENSYADMEVIDENPISFFLTSPEETDEFLDVEDLSAGIETPDSDRSPVRAVSPSFFQHDRLLLGGDVGDDDEDFEFGLAVPMALREFALKHVGGRKSHAPKQPEQEIKGRENALSEEARMRGRPPAKLARTRGLRGREQTRSLPIIKGRVWREPSPEIFPIQEEKETDEERSESIPAGQVLDCLSSAPSSTRFSLEMNERAGRMKQKKRVHWAL